MSSPAVWYKAGVTGDLSPELGRGFQKIRKLFAEAGQDLFVTSVAEGTHSMYTRHQCGREWSDAIDIRPGPHGLFQAIKIALGDKFDVCDETNHWHIEYDPK